MKNILIEDEYNVEKIMEQIENIEKNKPAVEEKKYITIEG